MFRIFDTVLRQRLKFFEIVHNYRILKASSLQSGFHHIRFHIYCIKFFEQSDKPFMLIQKRIEPSADDYIMHLAMIKLIINQKQRCKNTQSLVSGHHYYIFTVFEQP